LNDLAPGLQKLQLHLENYLNDYRCSLFHWTTTWQITMLQGAMSYF